MLDHRSAANYAVNPVNFEFNGTPTVTVSGSGEDRECMGRRPTTLRP
jgi:hypothetical protein